jgi:hypothetical protein
MIATTTARGLVLADRLALDPYSPTVPPRAPEWNDPHPLALNPYSPTVATHPAASPFPRDVPATDRQDLSTEET